MSLLAALALSALFSIAPEHQACKADSDCVRVMTECSCESCGATVHKDFEKVYSAKLESACKDYKGPVCRMRPCSLSPRCVENRCVNAKVPPKPEAEPDPSPVKKAAEVQVDPEHQLCAKNADCMTIPTACGCQPCGEPIRLMYAKEYEKRLAAVCANVKDTVQCDAYCQKVARCIDGRCKMVNRK